MAIKSAFLHAFGYEKIHKTDGKETRQSKIGSNILIGAAYCPGVGVLVTLGCFLLAVMCLNWEKDKPTIASWGLRVVGSGFGPLILPIADIAACIFKKVDKRAPGNI